MAAPATLLERQGRSWQGDAPVVAVAASGGCIGYAFGDGSVAITDGAALRRIACHDGSCLALAAGADADADGGSGSGSGSGSFVCGGDDGSVCQVSLRRGMRVLARRAGAWIGAVGVARSGAPAWADGRRVFRLDRPDPLELPAPATALAFHHDELAAAHAGGVTLWPAAGPPRRLDAAGYPRALAWSADGRFLAAGLQENALQAWRLDDGTRAELGGFAGQPLSLSFLPDARTLVAAGALRPCCWRVDAPAAARACGYDSRLPVGVVAAHPREPLIAAGYPNGAVLLCRPQRSEVLFVKGSGGGSVNALAWSGDGRLLAFGLQGGLYGAVPLTRGVTHS